MQEKTAAEPQEPKTPKQTLLAGIMDRSVNSSEAENGLKLLDNMRDIVAMLRHIEQVTAKGCTHEQYEGVLKIRMQLEELLREKYKLSGTDIERIHAKGIIEELERERNEDSTQ